jgi:ComEC/Rec2-related protein
MIEKLRSDLRQSVEATLGSGERSGLVLSLLLGQRDVLSRETEAAFKRTGLAHLLVVSGYQVTLVFYAAFGLFSFLLLRLLPVASHRVRFFWTASCALLVTVFFMLLIGIDGPSLRAVVAVTAFVLTLAFERRHSMYQAILVALFVVTVVWPGSFLEPGVQLTFAALFGLALGAGKGVRSYLKACCLASLFTSIVVLYWFEQFSLLGFILNPILAPLISVLSCYGGGVAVILNLAAFELPLKTTALLLEYSRDLVVWFSGIQYGFYELEGGTKMAVLLILSGVGVMVVVIRLLGQLRELGIVRGKVSEGSEVTDEYLPIERIG